MNKESTSENARAKKHSEQFIYELRFMYHHHQRIVYFSLEFNLKLVFFLSFFLCSILNYCSLIFYSLCNIL